jgi:hypothetical protein
MDGKRSEDTGEKLKGTSSIAFMGLENVRRYTRTKTDLAPREKELNFCYRALSVEKQEFGITSDCTIQPEANVSMGIHKRMSDIKHLLHVDLVESINEQIHCSHLCIFHKWN